MRVINSPIPEEDWEAFRKFLPQLPSFRYTSNPVHHMDKKEYRIDYIIEVGDENKLSNYLNQLKAARDAVEKLHYKSLSIFGKLKYLMAKRRERREKELRDENHSGWNRKYWRLKDWWGKDYTY